MKLPPRQASLIGAAHRSATRSTLVRIREERPIIKAAMKPTALALLFATLSLLALRPAAGQAPGKDTRLERRFSIDVRSAPLGDVAAQLGKTVNVSLAVDPSLADQRVDLRAPEANLADFTEPTAHLLSARW